MVPILKKQFFLELLRFAGVLLVCSIVPVWSANYYVSPTGSDANTGTSTTSAWQTIAKINGTGFAAGSKILFEGGKTFSGNLTFDASDGGDSTNPVIVTSYGTGRAIFNAGNGSGVVFSGAIGIKMTNIDLLGAGRSVNQKGKGVMFQNSTAGITVDSSDISGFQWAGVFFNKSSNIKVKHVNAHHNGYAGLTGRSGSSPNQNVYIGYSKFNDNIGDPTYSDMDGGGQGIEIMNITNAVVEYCEAARNGGDPARTYRGSGGGPVGIWTCSASNITFQNCVSHDNKTATGSYDGGGFDFDGSTSNCLIQYCYSYNNESSGLLVYAYSNMPVSNCTVRYFITQNDGINPHQEASFRFGGVSAPNINIYNCLAFNTGRQCIGGGDGNVHFYNNIFVIKGSNNSFGSGSTRANNCYWNYDNPGLVGPDGITADPQLADPGNGALLTDPTQLSQLTAYMLQPGSPCINTGIDVKATYGLEMGTRDFYGNTIPSGVKYDIGPFEYLSTPPTAIPTAPALTSPTNGATGVSTTPTLRWNTSNQAAGYTCQVSTASSFATIQYTNTVSFATANPTGLALGTLYYWRVNAYNSLGTSSWSTTNSFTSSLTITNLLESNNPGYETGVLSPWNGAWGSGTVVTGQAHSGTYAAKIAGSGVGFNWIFGGLLPSTTYTLTAYLKAGSAVDSVCIYAKDFGTGDMNSSFVKSTSYTQVIVTFSTPPGVTQATIGSWKPSGNGDAYIDDWTLTTGSGATKIAPAFKALQTINSDQQLKLFDVSGRYFGTYSAAVNRKELLRKIGPGVYFSSVKNRNRQNSDSKAMLLVQ